MLSEQLMTDGANRQTEAERAKEVENIEQVNGKKKKKKGHAEFPRQRRR